MVKKLFATVILLVGALVTSTYAPANAEDQLLGFHTGAGDPEHILNQIRTRELERNGLIPVSPIQPIRDHFIDFKDALYDATYLKIGLSFHHVFQGATEVLPGADDYGAATDFDFVGTLELFNRGKPTQGEVFFGVEGRWDYGTIGPQNIGFASVASSGGTANSFSAYDPNFLLRNLYYKQGGAEAGWVFRVGKITPDAMLLTNRHITPNTTFLPNAGTGVFAAGFPDSGLGFAGGFLINDRLSLGGLVSDSNADRYNFGDIGAGQFYKALELGFKIAPLTDQASFSKVLIWHTDGTKDRTGINANTGKSGWGFAIVAEQELTADGKVVVVGRYGRSFDKAAIYDQQAGLHLLLYEPFGKFDSDVIGVAFNWVDTAFEGRDEYNVETFYRFPIFPDVDMTLSHQAVLDPAFTREFDWSSVFSLRLITSF